MKLLFKAAILATVMGAATPAMALTATQLVQKEIITVQADGTETVSYGSAELVTPGERVAYMLNYNNDKAEPASQLKLVMPVPDVVVYAEGSARGEGTVVSYSADGENFYERSALRVATANGQTRSARAEDITHIRWIIAGPVNAGESGTLSFSGTLK